MLTRHRRAEGSLSSTAFALLLLLLLLSGMVGTAVAGPLRWRLQSNLVRSLDSALLGLGLWVVNVHFLLLRPARDG